MTDTTVPSNPDKCLGTRPLTIQSTRRRSLMQALTGRLHAWLAPLPGESAMSSIPRIRWP
ncbi:MAG TPA: hypothetical protein VF221_21690 [Chloroflexota bacterium]